jgi:hypothetical protein
MLPESMRGKSLVNSYSAVEEDPETAIPFLMNPPNGKDRDRALAYSAGYWACENPLAASEWVMGLEEGDVQKYATQNVMGSWVVADFDAASAWAQELPESESRILALVAAVKHAAVHHPVRSVVLAAKIADESLRRDSMQSVFYSLMNHDPERASEVLESVKMDDAGRENFKAQIEEFKRLEAALRTSLGGA